MLLRCDKGHSSCRCPTVSGGFLTERFDEHTETDYESPSMHVYVLCRFVLGRERDASHSEVARLIQMSIEQDRRRAEQRRIELEQRQHQLELQQRVYEYQLQQQQQLKQQSAGLAAQHEHSTGLPPAVDKVHYGADIFLSSS